MVSVHVVSDDHVVVVVVVFDGVGDGRLRDVGSGGLVVGFRVGQRHQIACLKTEDVREEEMKSDGKLCFPACCCDVFVKLALNSPCVEDG